METLVSGHGEVRRIGSNSRAATAAWIGSNGRAATVGFM
jgi:hypothetical protein